MRTKEIKEKGSENPEIKWISVPISKEIHYRLKIQAVINQITIPEMTERILERILLKDSFNSQESVL